MKYSSKELIREFYKEQKGKYARVSYEQFQELCTFPFEYLKQEILSGDLNSIRFKYLGTFLIYKSRVKYMIRIIEERLAKGEYTEDQIPDREAYLVKLKAFLDEYKDKKVN